jgi:hypothetical protein
MKAGTKLKVTITNEDGVVLDAVEFVLNNDVNHLEICNPLPGNPVNSLCLDSLQIGIV